MLAIIGRIQTSPGRLDELLAATPDLIAKTRTEQGCLLYSFARDAVEADVAWAVEQWESEADLHAHLKTPHVADFLVVANRVGILGMDARQYEVSAVGTVNPPAN